MNENEQNVSEFKNGKKKLGRKIWFVIFLLLPSLIAFFSFFIIYNNLYFSPSNIYDITLYDSEGNVMGEEKNYIREAEENGLVSLFSNITENLTEPMDISEHISTAHKFHAVVKYKGLINEYDFYFFSDKTEGYCYHNENGYLLSSGEVENFLSSSFAEELYETANIPLMYGISGDVILPRYVDWQYKIISGEFKAANNYESTSDILSYDMPSALYVYFSDAPDKCNVNVYKNGNEIFSGDTNQLSTLSLQKGEVIRVEVQADWFSDATNSFYGHVEYKFDVNITDQAEFYISDTELAIDSVFSILCTNVNDASNIEFTIDPPMSIEPRFEMSGDNAFALLPILPDAKLGEYSITLKYGATVQSFLITVNPLGEGVELECGADAASISTAFSIATSQELNDKIFYGKFLDYSEGETPGVQYSRFGDTYVNSKKEYISRGHEYRFAIPGGVSVGALNGGKVIKTGYNDYLGNYVVVSHGCGLATWYAHLSTIGVRDGDYVVKGESVGKTGVSGLSSVENVLVLVTLDNEFINPAYLCGKQFD